MLERRGDKITSCYQSTTSYARDTSTDALELSERREMMVKQIVKSKLSNLYLYDSIKQIQCCQLLLINNRLELDKKSAKSAI